MLYDSVFLLNTRVAGAKKGSHTQADRIKNELYDSRTRFLSGPNSYSSFMYKPPSGQVGISAVQICHRSQLSTLELPAQRVWVR